MEIGRGGFGIVYKCWAVVTVKRGAGAGLSLRRREALRLGCCDGEERPNGLAVVTPKRGVAVWMTDDGRGGYLTPEYAMRGILSHKADVYNFGVFLLEIVSGKSNAVSRPTQENVFLLDTVPIKLIGGTCGDKMAAANSAIGKEAIGYHQQKTRCQYS
ncbi:hypothetical protein RJ639_035153 [Escallonia herrerae]|uniref:Uncharacterized protein n=1 Tax=Escallonia herrerae TaxID=1293975 RepID=A0AA88WT49_9ASTE|nr:hypothetical protein RJ639_035153 [Escallonia herrerae]